MFRETLYLVRRPDSHSYLEVISIEGIGSAMGWTRDRSMASTWETISEAQRAADVMGATAAIVVSVDLSEIV